LSLKQPCEVHIVSDSKYVIQAIQEWLPNWKKNNWIGSNKKEIKNVNINKRIEKISFNV
jgi:ribonuclease HI